MALTAYQAILRRQPERLARINPRHWLASSLVFAHSGSQGFVGHQPKLPDASYALRRIGGYLGGAESLYGNASTYEEYFLNTGSGASRTFSAMVLLTGALDASSGALICAGSSSGTRSQFSLGSATSSSNPRFAVSDTNGTTETIGSGGSNNVLQHLVGVAISSSSRQLYLNGVLNATSAVNRSLTVSTDRVVVMADRSGGAGAISNRARTAQAFAVLLMMLDRPLSADEVKRLYEEQTTTPWVLFSERPIWVPVAAAGVATSLAPRRAFPRPILLY